MSYNTRNPVEPNGSSDPRDLFDNSGNLDLAVNGTFLTWLDRTGKTRVTLFGMEHRFEQFLIASGYQFVGDYDADGQITLTERNQIFSKDGEFWRVNASTSLPFTTSGAWAMDIAHMVSVGDAALRQELSGASGPGMIGYKATGAGSSAITLGKRLESLVLDGEYGSAQAAADSALGKVFTVPENVQISLDVPGHAATVHALYDAISRWIIPSNSTVFVKVGAGRHVYAAPFMPEHPYSSNIVLQGLPVTLTTSATSLVGFTGSRGNYRMTIGVTDSSQFSIGDWLGLEGATGTGSAGMVNGFYEVMGVSTGQLTLKARFWNYFAPAFTLTGGSIFKVHSLLQFLNVDGFVTSSSALMVRDIGVIGNMWDYWDENNILATEKGTHGFAISSNTIADGTGEPGGANPFALGGASLAAVRVYVADFDQQGFVVAGGAGMFGRYCWSSANARRNFYVGTASAMEIRVSGGNQSYRDCVIADYGGTFNANFFYASGCRIAGLFSNNGGHLMAVNSLLCGNLENGLDVRAGGMAAVDSSTIEHSGGDGAHFEYGANGSMQGAILRNNIVDGLSMVIKSSVRANNAQFLNNGRYGINSLDSSCRYAGATFLGNGTAPINNDALSVLTDGVVYAPAKNPVPVFSQTLVSPAGDKTVVSSVNSIGDWNISMNGVAQLQMKQSSISSAKDDDKTCGTSSLRFNTMFSKNGVQTTSDAREKTPVRPFTESEIRAGVRIGNEVGVWQWLQKVQDEGADARLHVGTTVQRVVEIAEEEGLDPYAMSLVCYDKWDDEFHHFPAVVVPDEKGNEVIVKEAYTVQTVVAGDRYSFRVHELTLFLIGTLFASQASIMSRLDVLEGK